MTRREQSVVDVLRLNVPNDELFWSSRSRSSVLRGRLSPEAVDEIAVRERGRCEADCNSDERADNAEERLLPGMARTERCNHRDGSRGDRRDADITGLSERDQH